MISLVEDNSSHTTGSNQATLIKHTLRDELDAMDNCDKDKIDPCLLIELESNPFSSNHFCRQMSTNYFNNIKHALCTLLASMVSIQPCLSSVVDALKKYVQSCTLTSNRSSSNSCNYQDMSNYLCK